MDPFLSSDFNIPKKDVRYLMPLRWKFTCWMSDYFHHEGWKDRPDGFKRWREYLLGWEIGGVELFISYIRRYPNLADKTALDRGYKCLQSYNATTLAGFIKFYRQCLKEYETALGHLDSKRNV